MTPGDMALERLRRRHVLRYRILLGLCLILSVSGLSGLVFGASLHPFLVSLSAGLTGLMGGGFFFLLRRKKRVGHCLASHRLEDAGHALAGYLDGDEQAWHRTTTYRAILGLGLLAGYFLLLLTGSTHRLTFMLPSFFILLVLLSMFRNWLLFLDRIFLQDVLHAGRDHSSGTPE